MKDETEGEQATPPKLSMFATMNRLQELQPPEWL